MGEKKTALLQCVSILLADFIICGFIGWVYETVLTSIIFGRFVERGILAVPILPIYGLFALVLPLIYKKEQNPVFIAVTGALGTTVFELIAAYVTEAIWHERLWSYADWKFNFFDGRISLFSSLIFGVMCVVFVKWVHPFMLWLKERFGRWFDISVFVITISLIVIEVML